MRALFAGIVVSLLLAAPAAAKVVKVTEGDGFYSTSLAQLPDGRLLVAGALNDGHRQKFAVARFSRNGKRDRTFGVNGLATATTGNGSFESPNALFVTADGRILAIGDAVESGSTMGIGIARWTADGRLDPSFGDGDGTLLRRVNKDLSMSFAAPYRGGFVFGGQTVVPAALPPGAMPLPGTENPFVEHKAFVEGLDTAWPSHASAPGNLPSPYFFDAEESEGGLVLAFGGTYRDAARKLSLGIGIARLNADGSYDQSFGDGGWKMIEYGPAVADYALQMYAELARRPGGGWLVAATGHKYLALSAWTAQGQPDPSWNGGRLDFNADGTKIGEEFGSLLPLSDGSVVVAGESLYRMLLSRFDASGSLDRGFGRKGRAILGPAQLRMSEFRVVTDLLAQPGGKVVVLGSGRRTPQSAKETVVLLRLKKNGKLDGRFGR